MMISLVLMVLVVLGLFACASSSDLPQLELVPGKGGLDVTRSCRLAVPAGVVFDGTGDDGLIRIAASDVVVEFAEGTVLEGSPADAAPDTYRGTAIRIVGAKNVTVRGGRLRGFRAGLWASHADGLVVEDLDASDNYRARLGSTPQAEELSDWVNAYLNDDNEWLKTYGSAFYLEDSDAVTLRRCRAQKNQNALCMDRLTGARIYDNDFSFNSCWGVALWRCERCTISRNAIDFCVRGYSHGIYNRGQDSAGILMFEQNVGNVIAENSGTHGGDGFFAGAGNEALGEAGPKHPDAWYKRRGNTDNLLIGNDFSYSPAHGVETTFSFGFRVLNNRLIGNAICGVWGGFSQDLVVAGNTIEDNGGGAYGNERGGINVDHGSHNRFVRNAFRNNRCGIHLWWTEVPGLADKPWGRQNGAASTDNLIADNTFTADDLVFHLHGKSDVTLGHNLFTACKQRFDTTDEVAIHAAPDLCADAVPVPEHTVFGETRPVGARPHLRGRENIIMTEWEPWDHTSPLCRILRSDATSATYELRCMPGRPTVAPLPGSDPAVRVGAPTEWADGVWTFCVGLAAGASAGCTHPYAFRLAAGNFTQDLRGALFTAAWDAVCFNWTDATNPLEADKLDAYRRLVDAPGTVKARLGLALSDLPVDRWLPADVAARVAPMRFGLVARTSVRLAKGTWRLVVMSAEGIRVSVDGRTVVDHWKRWRRVARHTGTFQVDADRTVEIALEHCELDKDSGLTVELVPVA